MLGEMSYMYMIKFHQYGRMLSETQTYILLTPNLLYSQEFPSLLTLPCLSFQKGLLLLQ